MKPRTETFEGVKLRRALAIIGCGASKLDEPAAARDLYTGTYFNLCLEFAELYATDTLILSAKHGLIHPDDELEPYDVRITDHSELARELYLERAARQFRRYTDWMTTAAPYSELTLLCGSDYREVVHEVVEPTRYDDSHIWTPFEDDDLEGIGDQQAWLSQGIRELQQREAVLESADHTGQAQIKALEGSP